MKCHNCGAELEDGVLFCRECGTEKHKSVKYCRDCGCQLKQGSHFCENCGASIRTEEDLKHLNTVITPEKRCTDNKKMTATAGQNNTRSAGKTKRKKKSNNSSSDPQKNVIMNRRSSQNSIFYGMVCLGFVCLSILLMVNMTGCGAGKSDTSSKETESVRTTAPQNDSSGNKTETTNYKIEKGSEYAYMDDGWNVYIATAISDSVLKIEHWSKSLSTTKKMKLEKDLGVFKINDPNNGFSWIDEDLAFSMTLTDKSASRLKKGKTVIFTVDTNRSDENKGASFDTRIASYSYMNDDWHLYRAIPLSEQYLKIETWTRTSSLDKLLYGDDVCVINIEDNSTDFEWLDDDHDAFMITLEDPDNSHYLKKPTSVLFELENPDFTYANVESFLKKEDVQKSSSVDEKEEEDISEKTEQNTEKPILEEDTPEPTVLPTAPASNTNKEYIKVTVDELKKTLDDNPMRAKETYNDAYLEVTGKLNNIDASQKYISLIGVNETFAIVGAQCYTKNDYHKAQIQEMNVDDIVTIRGKCKYVGELMGYQIDIDSIDGYEPTAAETSDPDEYIVCTASDLVNDLHNNAAKAKQKYLDHNIEVTGRIYDIDSKGKSISIEPADDPYSFTSITCNIKSKELKEKVVDLNNGDIITVLGKCTLVGEILGYSIAVESFK